MLKKTVVKKRAAPKKKPEVVGVDPKLDPKNWDAEAAFDVQRRDFPVCCGLQIICNLPYQVTKGVGYKGIRNYYRDPSEKWKVDKWTGRVTGGKFQEMPPSVARSILKQQIIKYMDYVPQGMLIALNSFQAPCLEELILEIGFKKVVEPFFYSGHRRDISLYFHTPMTGKKVESSVFGV